MRWLLAIVLVIAAPAIAIACMWDSDTLKQERARFPDALELITGKFLRHSNTFGTRQGHLRGRMDRQVGTNPADQSHDSDVLHEHGIDVGPRYCPN